MIELVIVTPEGEAYRGSVESVVLPGTEGDFGVLAGHERFLCPLRTGRVEIRNAGGSAFASIGGGFADVGGGEAAVLVESCELAADIDVARAESARTRAEQALGTSDAETEERAEHDAAMSRAENRLEVAKRG